MLVGRRLANILATSSALQGGSQSEPTGYVVSTNTNPRVNPTAPDSQRGIAVESQDGEGEEGEEEDADSVQMLMDILGLPQSVARDLLVEHYGDVSAAVASLLQDD